MRCKARAILPILLFCFLAPCLSEAGISLPGGLTYEKSAKAGETYSGAIVIKNSGDEIQEVKLYQTDYLFFRDGNNIYGEPGKDPRSNAKWITFSTSRVTVQSKGMSEVSYTVKVPKDKSLSGTYWSMLMVEGIGKDSAEATDRKVDKDKIEMKLRTVMRYGVQMVTHIGDTGTRSLKFLAIKLLKEDEDKRALQVEVENTGERLLKSTLWAEIYNEKGNYIGKFGSEKRRTYPGTSVSVKLDLGKVPEGKYKGLIVADCGGDDLFGISCTLEIGK